MHDLKTKTLVDERFEIIEKLGVGGMGVVYKAEQVGLDRIVALKVMLPHLLSDENSLARFEVEAQALAALTHRNISLFYAYGIWHGRAPYIAMEFLDTGDLSDLLMTEGGRLTWRRTLKIVRQICEGVGQAHKAGIIHRDLKPSNIFILHDGAEDIVKVGDFGLAKIVGEDGSAKQKLTATGLTLGSPLYMSPEQVQGLAATAASDIYSVGCLMYQCLFGRPPFEAATTYDVFAQHLESTCPIPKAEDLDSMPPEMVKVIETALAKNAGARFATMEQMADALTEIEKKNENVRDSKNKFLPQAQATRNPRRLSPAQIITSVAMVVTATLALLVVFSVPLLTVAAERLAKSGSAHTGNPSSYNCAREIAEYFDKCGAYNQAAPFYDAALSLAKSQKLGALRMAEISLAEATMFQRAGQAGRQQVALNDLAQIYHAALTSPRLANQTQDFQRKFVVSSAMALSQWIPPKPIDAKPGFQEAPRDAKLLGLLDESTLLYSMWLVWDKPIEYHPIAHTQQCLYVAVETLEAGPQAPYRADIVNFLHKALGHSTLLSPGQAASNSQAVEEALAKGDRSEALRKLLELAFCYCIDDQSESTALSFRRALFAYERYAESRDDLNIVFYCSHALAPFITTRAADEQIEFLHKALVNEDRRAVWDEARLDFRSKWDRILAQVFLDQHQPNKAIAVYEASIHTTQNQKFKRNIPNLDRFVMTCNLAIGRILLQEGKWKEALPHFQKIQRNNPDFVGPLQHRFATYGVANCIYHLEGAEAALKALKADYQLDRANIYILIGQYDQALKQYQDYERLVSPGDVHIGALTAIGRLYGLMNDERNCLATFKQAIEETHALKDLNKTSKVAGRRFEYARALIRFGNTAEGKAQLAQAQQEMSTIAREVDRANGLKPVFYELGNLYLAENNFAEAEKAFTKCRQSYEKTGSLQADYRCVLTGQALAVHDMARAKREVFRACDEYYYASSWPECDAMSWSARVDLASGDKELARKGALQALTNWKMCNRMIPATSLVSEYLATRSLCRALGIPLD